MSMSIPTFGESIFRTERLFYHSFIGENESWFFYNRNRDPVGPFKDRDTAIIALCDHVTYYVKKGDSGGR
jgi:hypothetical protein